jgi:hypothetical protein
LCEIFELRRLEMVLTLQKGPVAGEEDLQDDAGPEEFKVDRAVETEVTGGVGGRGWPSRFRPPNAGRWWVPCWTMGYATQMPPEGTGGHGRETGHSSRTGIGGQGNSLRDPIDLAMKRH